MSPPLAGLTVLDLGQFISTPMAGQNLADMGARVIKIESPSGEQARNIGTFGEAMVEACNRGKDSLALNLCSPEGQATLHELLAETDILIHNFLPRTAAKLGLDWATLSAQYPRLICGSVTGFGSLGPHANAPGLDIMAQAEFGVMGVTGESDGLPQRVGFTVSDLLASHALTSGVLAAVIQRATTGKGVLVETSLMEATVHALAPQWAEYSLNGTPPLRKGNGQPQVAPAADAIEVLDSVIVLSAYTANKWASLCEVLGRPELENDPRFCDNPSRVENRAALLSIITAFFKNMTAAEATATLRAGGIVCGKVRTLDDIAHDPDLLASGQLTEVTTPSGATHVLPGLPISFDGVRPVARTAAPAVDSYRTHVTA